MNSAEVIAAALAGMTHLSKVIEMANNGDAEAAARMLADARKRFSESVDAWDRKTAG